jgi:hypothetical protein
VSRAPTSGSSGTSTRSVAAEMESGMIG